MGSRRAPGVWVSGVQVGLWRCGWWGGWWMAGSRHQTANGGWQAVGVWRKTVDGEWAGGGWAFYSHTKGRIQKLLYANPSFLDRSKRFFIVSKKKISITTNLLTIK